MARLILVFTAALVAAGTARSAFAQTNNSLPAIVRNVDIALQAKQDFWGQIAVRQPGGPSYEFFRDLMPPLRYVDAAFRNYPIVLSAPGAQLKPRLISNGSVINALARKKTWKDFGIPVTFLVGDDQELFGSDLTSLDGPHYESGYLPIVSLTYKHKGASFREEVFASTDRLYSDGGLVFVKFTNPTNAEIKITGRLEPLHPFTVADGAIRDTNSYAWVWFDGGWIWDPATSTLTTKPKLGQSVYLAIASRAMAQPVRMPDLAGTYAEQRRGCLSTWQTLLNSATSMTVPEPIVNNARRASIIADYMILKGDDMNYSAGNYYERLYEAECGDTVYSLMQQGLAADTPRMIVPLLKYSRTNGNYSLRFHQAAYKLQLLAYYYWLTRDVGFIREQKPLWQREVDLLSTNREPGTGILPKEQYAGDIFDRVYSLNSNANGWRGLRDIAAVLIEIGDREDGQRIASVAADFRKAILTAVDKSIDHSTEPPFIPLSLYGHETPYDPITATKMGSYWNLMAPYILGSGVFGLGDERETWLIQYLQEHGGVCMGLTRFDQHSGLFANENGVDDLYSLRYVEALLKHDDPNHALISFYGKLAQGMTRDTFIGGEGSSLKALDAFGRPMYLPPNSTGNALFLITLRDLLVQDWDLNDDGKPDTLRLMFATPRRWLEDGKEIKVERAPTAFGDVTARIYSKINSGQVIADITPPLRNPPKQSLLRIRLPDGWMLTAADVQGQKVEFDGQGTLNITPFKDHFTMRCTVGRAR